MELFLQNKIITFLKMTKYFFFLLFSPDRDHPVQGVRGQVQRGPLRGHHLRGVQGQLYLTPNQSVSSIGGCRLCLDQPPPPLHQLQCVLPPLYTLHICDTRDRRDRPPIPILLL